MVVVVVVVVGRTPTPNYLRQASQNLGKYIPKYFMAASLQQARTHTHLTVTHSEGGAGGGEGEAGRWVVNGKAQLHLQHARQDAIERPSS